MGCHGIALFHAGRVEEVTECLDAFEFVVLVFYEAGEGNALRPGNVTASWHACDFFLGMKLRSAHLGNITSGLFKFTLTQATLTAIGVSVFDLMLLNAGAHTSTVDAHSCDQ
jgi:hypothetical protein